LCAYTVIVKINLADKIADNVTKVMARRYIVRFEKSDVNTLTTNGQNSLDEFNNLNQVKELLKTI
jgi:hypothetical protein